MSEHILIERQGSVQIIRLNRADKKNAITRAMYAAMAKALVDGDADDAVRVHVFLGVPGAFSSGNDMQDFMAAASGGNMGNDIMDFLAALSGAKKPIVSGVDGLAIGIGTTIHLHCDLTFATNHALFRTPLRRPWACAGSSVQPTCTAIDGPPEGIRTIGAGTWL
jgi:enoyl-CoA hydratase/carnithine racemase